MSMRSESDERPKSDERSKSMEVEVGRKVEVGREVEVDGGRSRTKGRSRTEVVVERNECERRSNFQEEIWRKRRRRSQDVVNHKR
jgi:hypothetical protein